MQKLIAYDHLEGDPGLDGGKNVPLFTDILNLVCGCVDNSSPDRYPMCVVYVSAHHYLSVARVLLFVNTSLKFFLYYYCAFNYYY